MSNEGYYNYYKVDAEASKDLENRYAAIEIKRDETLKQMLNDFSCIAWTVCSGWGLQSTIDEIVFESREGFSDKDFKIKEARHEGKKVYCVYGKRNSKIGNEFNRRIADYNKILKDLPSEPDFIFNELNVRATGMGGASGRGVAMLSTHGGRVGNDIYLAIPKNPDGKFTLPDGLSQITYGTFYDAVNSNS